MEKTSCPKRKCRMGSKKTLSLLQATSCKNVWRLIQGKGIWVQVIRAKYISPSSVEDWVRNLVKQVHNASIIWKVVNSSFHLVGN
jgi:hypothetical protein